MTAHPARRPEGPAAAPTTQERLAFHLTLRAELRPAHAAALAAFLAPVVEQWMAEAVAEWQGLLEALSVALGEEAQP